MYPRTPMTFRVSIALVLAAACDGGEVEIDPGRRADAGWRDAGAPRDAAEHADARATPDARAEGGSDAGALPVIVTTTIGPAGGSLAIDGVEAIVPADAFAADTEVTLSVWEGPVIEVTPHVWFAPPVVLRLDAARWALSTDHIVQHEETEGFSMIGYVDADVEDGWFAPRSPSSPK
jgi:hypothetical protein